MSNELLPCPFKRFQHLKPKVRLCGPAAVRNKESDFEKWVYEVGVSSLDSGSVFIRGFYCVRRDLTIQEKSKLVESQATYVWNSRYGVEVVR